MNYKVTGFRPVSKIYPISSYYGEKRDDLAKKLGLKNKVHNAIDFKCPVGTPVRAFKDGKVQLSGEADGYGYRIWVYHDMPRLGNAFRSCYAHLSKMKVVAGNNVKEGEVIGYSGGIPGTPGAGSSTGAHLHFECRVLPSDDKFEPTFYASQVDEERDNEAFNNEHP